MPDIPETGPTPRDRSSVDLGSTPRGTSIPFQTNRFGISSHITPSMPLVEVPSHTHHMPTISVPIRGPEPRHVNIGGTSYIPSHMPLSSAPIPSNVFLTMHPPPNSSGPYGQSSTTSHACSTSTNTIVSQGHVPPYVLVGHVPSYGPSYGPSHGPSHGLAYGTSYGLSYRPS